MSSPSKLCPRCKLPLTIPQPAPPKVECASCGAIVKISSKIAAAPRPAATPVAVTVLPPLPYPTTPVPLTEMKTELVSDQPPVAPVLPDPPVPPRRPARLGWLVGVAAAVVLVLLALLPVLFWLNSRDKDAKGTVAGGKDPDKSPNVLIDEDFRTTFENRAKLTIPEKWESDDFRVVKDNDLFALEVAKPTGVGWVTVPLSSTLSGNFSIEGAYIMGHPAFANYHALTISLQNRKTKEILTVVFDWQGQVQIDKDSILAPSSYKPLTPTHFLLKREGKKLRVFLNKDPVKDKNMDQIAEYDTLRLGLNAGPGNGGRLARLYGLRVATLPE